MNYHAPISEEEEEEDSSVDYSVVKEVVKDVKDKWIQVDNIAFSVSELSYVVGRAFIESRYTTELHFKNGNMFEIHMSLDSFLNKLEKI